MEHLQY
jgi:hypothetical protein